MDLNSVKMIKSECLTSLFLMKGKSVMDMRDLAIFRTIAMEGNITKAARKLNYVQSNLTGRLKLLESELKTTLFYRHARGMKLTASGKELLVYADKILRLIDEAKTTIIEDHEPAGILSIGAIESTTSVRLPSILSTYLERYPNVDLTLTTGTTDGLVEAVLNHELDGAFVVGPIKHNDILIEPFHQEELVVITNNDLSLLTYLEGIGTPTLLTRPNCVHRLKLEKWLSKENIYFDKVIEFSTFETIIEYVKMGLGTAILPYSFLRYHSTDKRLFCHKVPDDYSMVKTVFIQRRDIILRSALKKFREMIQ